MTGSTGYLGSHLQLVAAENGLRTEALLNTAGAPWRLGDAINVPQLNLGSEIWHLAWDRSASAKLSGANLHAARQLAEVSIAKKLKVVFASSFSVLFSKSRYAEEKNEAERILRSSGAQIVRIGLVWGGAQGGALNLLQRVSSLTPLVPLPLVPVYVHLANIQDVCYEFVKQCHMPTQEDIYCSHPSPMELSEIVKRSAQRQSSQRCIRCMPSWMLKVICRCASLSRSWYSTADSMLSLITSDCGPQDLKGSPHFRRFDYSLQTKGLHARD